MEWFQVLGVFGLFLHSGAQNNTTSVPVPSIGPGVPQPSHTPSVSPEVVPQPSYMLLAPKSLRPGLPTAVSVTILTASPVSVVAEIVNVVAEHLVAEHLWSQSITSNRTVVNGGSTKLLVLPPITQTENGRYELTVRGYAGDVLLFTNSSALRLESKSASTFIQTDKPLYRPGQAVRIRAVSVHPDGKPYDSPVDIIVKDPRGNRIRQWLSLDSVLGVVSQQYQLSDNPPLGKWTIRTSVNNITSEKHFKVDHYVLPKFEVVISAPPIIFHEDTLQGSITAKYLYGKPVFGRMNITYMHHFHGVEQSYYESQVIDGTTSFTFEVPDYVSDQFSKRDVEFNYFDDFRADEFVTVVVDVTESLTGLTSSSTTEVSLAKERYKITFQGCPPSIRPSLNITCQLKVSTYDGLPPRMTDRGKTVTVRLTQHGRGPWSWRLGDTLDLDLDMGMDRDLMLPPVDMPPPHVLGSRESPPFVGGGQSPLPLPDQKPVVEMEFPVTADGVIPLFFQLTDDVETATIDASFEDTQESLSLFRSYSSPSQSYLQVQKPLLSPQVDVPLPLIIQRNFPVSEVHYMVESRGQIVSAGTSSVSGLVVTPERSWAPLACIIVYCVRPDGEIVNDVLQLHVAHGLQNQVFVHWRPLRARPADTVTLALDGLEPGSLVSLLVVDKATRLTGAHNDITEEKVLEELAGYSGPDLSLGADGMAMTDPHSIFMTCDLVVLTDANYQRRRDPQRPELREGINIQDGGFPNGMYEEPEQAAKEPRERWNFPETWLWQDFNASSDMAELTVTVPDSITTWTATAFVMSKDRGLGIIQMPAELVVFQDFFLSVNVPAFIIRGEELVLEVILFNHLPSDKEVTVIVAESESFEFVYPDNEEIDTASVRKVYVGSQTGKSVLFPIKPSVLGEIFISVKAMSDVASDAVRKTVLVKPEGLEQSFSSAVFLEFAASERFLSKQVSFTFPADVVGGSERAHVTAFGDILGPSITGLDHLVQMPYGCGEQNMIHFAPNIYVLQYLAATGQADRDITAKATSFMMNGYERQLSYQREDGSFSAFGDHDRSGSTWLSAFVLRCFLQARPFMDVDERVVQRTAAWLSEQEGPDGRFLEPGRVIHTELQGGLDVDGPGVSLTAYVLMALLEDHALQSQYESQVSAALTFLETRLALGISSNYSLCLVSYSLALANSTNAETALEGLMARADMRDGVPFWGSSSDAGLTPSWQPRTTSLEMAAYVLLALHRLGQPQRGVPLAKWLSQQRNHLGGHSSTQDTVLALQALSQFAVYSTSRDMDMTVRVSTGDPSIAVASFHIDRTNALLHQSQQIETSGSELRLRVTAEGQGFALFQLNVFYNIENTGLMARRRRNAHDHEAFHLRVDLDDDLYDSSAYLHICTSLSRSQAVNQTGMAILEVGLLSGFAVAQEGVPTSDVIKKVEMPAGKVVLYLDSVTTTEMCIEIPLVLEYKVARVQDANVVIYDYYETGRRAVRSYRSQRRQNMTTCSFCGSGCDDCRATQHDQFGFHSTAAAPAAPARCRHLVVSLLSALLLLLVF